jgi:hypothetical protein
MSAIHTPHFWILLAALAAVFVFREIVAYRRMLRLKYILTPTITMLIILLVVLSMHTAGVNYYRTMVFLALLLGLVGDTLLMIEEINLLEHGMLFFLAGHCMYIAVFVTRYSPSPWHIALALALVAGQAAFYSFIRQRTGKHNLPVFFYYARDHRHALFRAFRRANRDHIARRAHRRRGGPFHRVGHPSFDQPVHSSDPSQHGVYLAPLRPRAAALRAFLLLRLTRVGRMPVSTRGLIYAFRPDGRIYLS